MPEPPPWRGHNGGPPLVDPPPPPPPPSPVTTIRNGAAYIGVGLTTIYALIAAGELPTVRLWGRTLLRFRDLDALLDRNEHRGPARGPQRNPHRDALHRVAMAKTRPGARRAATRKIVPPPRKDRRRKGEAEEPEAAA